MKFDKIITPIVILYTIAMFYFLIKYALGENGLGSWIAWMMVIMLGAGYIFVFIMIKILH